MSHKKFVFIFFTVILVHNSVDAMKRALEDGTVVLPKRIKLVLEEESEKVFNEPQKYQGMYYCSKDDNCSYATNLLRKINEHHILHGDPNAILCEQCDYRGARLRAVINHKTKWHGAAYSDSRELIIKPKKLKCGYCKMEVSNMDYHKKLYHTPSLNRNHDKCFPLRLPKKSTKDNPVLISSDSEFE